MSKWLKFVYYDETSPSCLRWACDRGNGNRIGGAVGSLDKDSTWSFVLTAFGVKKRRYCHRVIYEIFNGDLGGDDEIDHEDGRPWNNRKGNLRKVTSKVNSRNICLPSDNKSGTMGVTRVVVHCRLSGDYPYWVATWVTLGGVRKNKYFSIKKLGEDAAKDLAKTHREKEIMTLNLQGAGYTSRHGTPVPF